MGRDHGQTRRLSLSPFVFAFVIVALTVMPSPAAPASLRIALARSTTVSPRLASGLDVLCQLLVAMRGLHSVRGNGYLFGGTATFGGTGTMSGACQGQIVAKRGEKRSVTNLRSRSWFRGTLYRAPRPPQHVDSHLIVVETPPGEWERSERTHFVWRSVSHNPPINVIYVTEMCLPLFAPTLQFPPPERVVRDLGPVRIGNRRAIHLRISTIGGNATDREDIYLDRVSRYWLRVAFRQHDADTRTSAGWTFDYSSFNQPMCIVPPRRG
jgi:hypothetical protein